MCNDERYDLFLPSSWFRGFNRSSRLIDLALSTALLMSDWIASTTEVVD